MVNTMMTRFTSRDAPGIDFRPIWVRNGKAWFAKQHLIKVNLYPKVPTSASWR
jgi:hypothetical protein